MTREMRSNDWNELRKIIDDGMAKQDREISIGFYESATLVTIAPMSTDEEELHEDQKKESEKSKNEIIVRVPYSSNAKMEAACCEEELKRKGVKIEQMDVSGVCSAVDTERHRFIFWPIHDAERSSFFLRGMNVRALVGFSTEELKEFVGVYPGVLICDCFTDILDLLF